MLFWVLHYSSCPRVKSWHGGCEHFSETLCAAPSPQQNRSPPRNRGCRGLVPVEFNTAVTIHLQSRCGGWCSDWPHRGWSLFLQPRRPFWAALGKRRAWPDQSSAPLQMIQITTVICVQFMYKIWSLISSFYDSIEHLSDVICHSNESGHQFVLIPCISTKRHVPAQCHIESDDPPQNIIRQIKHDVWFHAWGARRVNVAWKHPRWCDARVGSLVALKHDKHFPGWVVYKREIKHNANCHALSCFVMLCHSCFVGSVLIVSQI